MLLAGACSQLESGPFFIARYDVEEGQYGFMDRYGEVEILAHYDFAVDFAESLAAVNIGGKSIGGLWPLEGKWGFISTADSFKINPTFDSPPVNSALPGDKTALAAMLHEGYRFSEGLAAVYKEGRWVYIDSVGGIRIEQVIDTSYKSGKLVARRYDIQSARMFREGHAMVCVDDNWGLINQRGYFVIRPQYMFPVDLENNLIFAVGDDFNRYNLRKISDQSGSRFVPVQLHRSLSTPYHEGRAVFERPNTFEELEDDEIKFLYGLIDSTDLEVLRPQFDALGRYGAGLVPARVGSRQRDLLLNNEEVKPGLDVGGRWAFVKVVRGNTSGTIAINPIFDDAKGFSHGYAAVKKDGYWGYIDTDGDWFLRPQFRWAGFFHEQMAIVLLGPGAGPNDNKYAYLNLDGDIIYILPD